MASDAEHPCICLRALCMSSLEKCLFKSFAHFLIGFLRQAMTPGVESCEFFIYFGDQTLVWSIICKYNSHMVGSLFVLLMLSLAMQKLFILMKSHLFILFFMSLSVGDILMKILLCRISEIFLHMFSSRTLMVLWLILKSFIHLEFTFVYGVSWWSSFIFLHVTVQISQHHLLNTLFLLHLCFCLLCQTLIDCGDLG